MIIKQTQMKVMLLLALSGVSGSPIHNPSGEISFALSQVTASEQSANISSRPAQTQVTFNELPQDLIWKIAGGLLGSERVRTSNTSKKNSITLNAELIELGVPAEEVNHVLRICDTFLLPLNQAALFINHAQAIEGPSNSDICINKILDAVETLNQDITNLLLRVRDALNAVPEDTSNQTARFYALHTDRTDLRRRFPTAFLPRRVAAIEFIDQLVVAHRDGLRVGDLGTGCLNASEALYRTYHIGKSPNTVLVSTAENTSGDPRSDGYLVSWQMSDTHIALFDNGDRDGEPEALVCYILDNRTQFAIQLNPFAEHPPTLPQAIRESLKLFEPSEI